MVVMLDEVRDEVVVADVEEVAVSVAVAIRLRSVIGEKAPC